MSDREPVDRLIREQALDPAQSFIVEAPAGSGKTELLTRRFLRLLACVKSPEEILAITFTRKAAAEMRRRVLQALNNAACGTASANASLQLLARDALEADARHGWQLQSQPARLRIMTIDALNSSLARQLPILSGSGAMLPIERDAGSLYEDVAARLVERLGERDAAADALARLLRHLDNQFERFAQLLADELARREYWLDLGVLHAPLPELRQRLESALQEQVATELGTVCAEVPFGPHAELIALAAHAAEALKSANETGPILLCEGLREFPSASAASLEHWQGIAELLLTKDGAWRKSVTKRTGFPPSDPNMKTRMLALLDRLQDESRFAVTLQRVRMLPRPNYSEDQWQVLTDLLVIVRIAIAELEVVMRERGAADYVANAIAARRALGSLAEPTELALRLDYRLQHLLVDEFQDTSRGQVELLTLLTAGWSDGDGRTIFCVGDPMQSIYRFRHADVGLFLNLRNAGLNHLRLVPLRLSVSFRASRPVLAWINQTFAKVLPPHDDPERGAVAFTSSEAGPAASDNGKVVVHPIVGDPEIVRTIEARQIVDLIVEHRKLQESSSAAVLVANRMHLTSIVRELRLRQVPFNAVDIDPLAERPSVQDLVALTRAVVHLGDRTAWLAVLRAPWCGLSLADLHALAASDSSSKFTLWQAVNEPERVASLSVSGRTRVTRLQTILEYAFQLRGRISLRECVERTWHALGGPATVASIFELDDCNAYLDRLETIEHCGDLEDPARLQEQLSDLFARPDAGQFAAVELMTIHRAKGLEFDLVILPGLDRSPRHDDQRLLQVHESARLGEHKLALAPIPPRGIGADAIYRWMSEQERERTAWEQGRVLYVAATRARSELHLFGAARVENGELRKPRIETFLRLLWPVVEAQFAQAAANMATLRSAPATAYSQVETWRLPEDWHPPMPFTPSIATAVRDIRDDEPIHPQFEWAGETARHVGTLTHREIERLTRVSAPGSRILWSEQIKARLASQCSLALAELGVPPGMRGAAVDRVCTGIGNMLEDPRGRWLLGLNAEIKEAASEFALSGVVDGELLNGVVDRTFVDGDGVRWIVDFKTSVHEGGGIDVFLANEVERYRPQLNRYASLMRGLYPQQAIRAALYFPLLREWREVDLEPISSSFAAATATHFDQD